jgi:uncharacterized protein (TIGR02001 family)
VGGMSITHHWPRHAWPCDGAFPMKSWILLLCLLSAATAQAQDAGTNSVSGDVSVVSDYLFRGISQTHSSPALQGDVEYAPFGGIYAGIWASNIDWLSDESTVTRRVTSNVEIDAYAGDRGTFNADWSYDVGLYTYNYPGTYPPGFTSANTQEGYAGLTWKAISLEYSLAFSNLFGIAHSAYSQYFEAAWSKDVLAGWTLKVHLARQTVADNPGYSYWDWKLGMAHDLSHGWTLSLAYYATDARRRFYTNSDGLYLGRTTGVLTIDKSF